MQKIRIFLQGFLLVLLPLVRYASGGDTPVSQGLSYIITSMYGDTGIAIATIALLGVGLLCLGHVMEWRRFFQTLAGVCIIFGAGAVVSAIHGLVSSQ